MNTKLKHYTQKRSIIYGLYLLLASVGILLFATKSSPLYVYNNWCDANSYFSVGKAMFNGLIPYKDVFDQKGMYLYFMYGLCYLISNATFMGVFIMEIGLGFLNLLGLYRILRLYLSHVTSLAMAPISLAVIVSSYSFYMGGSAEELCLPCYIWALYIVVKYARTRRWNKSAPMATKYLFIGGVLAGIVANIKFTGLGFFFGWMAWVFFDMIFRPKQRLRAFVSCLWFLFGMMIPFIPWIIYFDLKNEITWWYWGYVGVNVFSYSNFGAEGPTLFERIYNLAKIALWTLQDNPVWFIPLLAGIAFNVTQAKAKMFERFLTIMLMGFLFIGIYVGGSFLPYYALPLSVFNVFGFALAGQIIERIFGHGTGRLSTCCQRILRLSCFIIAIGIVFIFSMNIRDLGQKKDEHYLTEFTNIIEESGIENPTLLNINCLDAGLYTTANIVPNCQWFQTQTINSSVPYDEQDQYIREGLIDFVIASKYYPEHIFNNYELVSEFPWSQEGYDIVYYLFQKKQ